MLRQALGHLADLGVGALSPEIDTLEVLLHDLPDLMHGLCPGRGEVSERMEKEGLDVEGVVRFVMDPERGKDGCEAGVEDTGLISTKEMGEEKDEGMDMEEGFEYPKTKRKGRREQRRKEEGENGAMGRDGGNRYDLLADG
ncbi:MAG: hypothetical protein Q9225_007005 [Loekoesia sp. 1 TL-2023]